MEGSFRGPLLAPVVAILLACAAACAAPSLAHAAAGDLLFTLHTHLWEPAWERGVAGAVDAAGNYYAAGVGERADVDGSTGYIAARRTPAATLDWLLPWVPAGGATGDDYARDVAVTPAGDMITVGSVGTVGGGRDVQLVCRDTGGTVAWTATWSGPGYQDDDAAAIARGPDGSLYVVGSSTATDGDADVITLKFGAAGDFVWARRLNGRANGDDSASAVCLHGNNVYVGGMVTGRLSDGVLIKYDTAGVRKWVQRFDGSRHLYDWVTKVVADRHSVYVAGGITTTRGARDMLRRYRPSGSFEWMRVSGARGSEEQMWADVALTPAGDAVVTGQRWMDEGYDWATAVYRSSGSLLWSKRISTDGYDGGNAVAVDPSGRIYVAGSYHRGGPLTEDGAVACYAPSGTRRWMTFTGLPSFDTLFDLSLSSDRVYATGDTYDQTNLGDFLLVEIEK